MGASDPVLRIAGALGQPCLQPQRQIRPLPPPPEIRHHQVKKNVAENKEKRDIERERECVCDDLHALLISFQWNKETIEAEKDDTPRLFYLFQCLLFVSVWFADA
jgi:hypothetical protein